MNDVSDSRLAIPGIHAVYVGVREFAPVVRALRDGLAWTVTDLDEVPSADSRDLWGVDASAEVMTMAPDHECPSGVVNLLRFPPENTPAPRGAPHMSGFGALAISLYAQDTVETVRRLEYAGGHLRGEIATFPVQRGESLVQLRAGLVELPDDLNVLVIEPAAPRPTWTWANRPEAPVTEINFMVYSDPEQESLLDWWGPKGLGLPLAGTGENRGDPVSRMTGTAPGLSQRNGVTDNPQPARLELTGPNKDLASLDPGVVDDYRARQFPGASLGQVLWRVVLPRRPESFAGWAAERDTRILRLPHRRRSAHFAGRAVGIVEGPGGQRVQVEIPGA
jgi:hypothetical protein